MLRFICVALLSMLAGLQGASAQSLDEIRKRDAAVVEAWQKTPLTVQRAVFVSEHPKGYGQFVARTSNTFKVGEKLVAYLEPIGYGWKKIGDEEYQFGFAVDFVLKSPDGKILAGQEDFAKLMELSHSQNREFMVTLTLDLTGAPAGEYKLDYKLRDLASDKSTVITLPFKLVE